MGVVAAVEHAGEVAGPIEVGVVGDGRGVQSDVGELFSIKQQLRKRNGIPHGETSK